MPSLPVTLSRRIIIGITGHRDLFPSDESLLRACLRERLMQIPGLVKNKLLLTALAPGADQLAAEVARELGIAVCALLPMLDTDYRLISFADEAAAFQQFLNWQTIAAHVHYLHDQPIVEADEGKAAEERQQCLEVHATTLAGWSDHLIALWDGNDNGYLGGPSHIVRMARRGVTDAGHPLPRLSDLAYAGRLHHLLTRRCSNPFPVGPLGDATTDLPRRGRALPLGTASPADDVWHNKPFGTDGTWQTFVLPRYKPRLGLWRQFTRTANTYYESIIRYALPAFFFLVTVLIGGLGYQHESTTHESAARSAKQVQKIPTEKPQEIWIGDAWAKGADLADPTTVIEEPHPDRLIVWGRALGLLTFMYSVGINVLFVFGDQGIILFMWVFWLPGILRLFGRRGRGFNIICGLTEVSYNLFLDLQSKGERVLILDAEADKSPYKADCISRGAIVLAKDPLSNRLLSKFFIHRAKRLFAMTVSETNNVRIIQQAYQLQDTTPSPSKVSWFAQATDVRIRDLLFHTLKVNRHPNVTIYSFDLFTNIVRRQLHDYPLDRFHLAPRQLKQVKLVVFGFSPIAQQLVVQALQTGIYNQDRRLFIRVYTTDPEKAEAQFVDRYPALNDSKVDSRLAPVQAEITSNNPDSRFNLKDILCFEDQHTLQTDLFYGGQLLQRDFADDSSTNLYVCQDDGMLSVALLRELLPRVLPHLPSLTGQRRDIQAFAFYNSSNQTEEFQVEAQLNHDFPAIPITFFGNYLEACSEAAICHNAIDNLPELIHWHYAHTFDTPHTKPQHNLPSKYLILKQLTNVWNQLFLPKLKAFLDSFRRRGLHYLSPQELTHFRETLATSWRGTNESKRESSRLAADHLWVKYRLALTWFREQYTDSLQADQAMQVWLNQCSSETADQTTIIPWDEDSLLNQLAIVEHRRWLVSQLMAGFRPYLTPSDYMNTQRLTELVDRWNNDTVFKKSITKQKMHLDLVPSSVLNKYTTNGPSFQHKEKHKDIDQVRGMARFFKQLDNLERL